MKAIVYTSNAGHTRQYAAMLGIETGLPVHELAAAASALPKGSEIIYLGWLMAGNIKGYKKAARHFDIKAVCGVGMAKTGTQLTDMRKANKLPEALPVFSLQGGFELEKLNGVYKLMMSTMKATAGKGLADKTERTPEEDEMLDLLTNGGSKVSRDNLKEVLEWYSKQKG